MKDSDIFNVIIKDVKLLDQVVSANHHFPTKQKNLFSAYWVSEENAWMYSGEIDPLSAVLLVEQLEPYRKGDDDLAVATLSNLFSRYAGWIRSFQIGILGQANSGSSISGYLMGVKIKKELCIQLAESKLPPSVGLSK